MSEMIPRLVGQRVKRVEDPRLLTGRGEYVDDVHLPRMLHVALLRSSVAHARIVGIDTAAAAELPGVHLVVTADDLRDRVQPIVCDILPPGAWQTSAYPILADGKVRFVGEPVVAVVADSRYVAEDALEAIGVSYEELPPVMTVTAAEAGPETQVHEAWDEAWFTHKQLRVGDIDRVFAEAAGVTRRSVEVGRHTGMPLETRAIIADYNPSSNALTVHMTTQMPHIMRTGLADHLGMPEHQIRVISKDVGGGFGVKAELYPEDILVSHLATRLGRPVSWVEDRREHLLGTIHAREHFYELEAAWDESGRILAVRAEIRVDGGAYSVYPYSASMEPGMAMGVLTGMYDVPVYHADSWAIATNKTPLGPYRGVARPSACFAMERLMDAVAHDTGIDPLELRRRNLVRADQMPHTTPSGLEYDSGDFGATFRKAAEILDYDATREQQEELRGEGRYLGIGVGSYVEQTAHGAAEFVKRGLPVIFGYDTSRIRIDASGNVLVHPTSHSHGQGHETTIAQVVADALGIEIERIRVVYGDTQDVAYGSGTLGSRSMVMAGGAAHLAAVELRDRLVRIAAHNLEVDPGDLEVADGEVRVKGSPATAVAITEIARWAHHRPERIPSDLEPTLEVTSSYGAPPGTGAFSHAVHMALVEVDPALGTVQVLRYVVAEDCGRIVNPMIVDGQVTGGVAQGLGGALLEEIVHDAEGQPLTTSLLDYLWPTAHDVPFVEIGHLESLSPFTIGGIKGMGEGGAIAPGAVIAGAVEDALRPLGGGFVRKVPLTPERVLNLLNVDPTGRVPESHEENQK